MGNAARKPVFLVSNQLSSGFTIRSYQKQPAQPQRLARMVKFRLQQVLILFFPISNNKNTDQTVWMHRLVCAFVVRKPPKTGFLASRQILYPLEVKRLMPAMLGACTILKFRKTFSHAIVCQC